MNKIKCDICGTTYPDTATSCPICGWTHNGQGVPEEDLDLGNLPEEELLDDAVLEGIDEEFPAEETAEEPAEEPAEEIEATVLVSEKKAKAIFDYDAVNTAKTAAEPEVTEAPAEAEEPEEEEHHTNVFLVILLVLVILALLAATGYMFVRYFLPGRAANDTPETVPVATAEVVQTSAETTEPTIPCENLALPNGIDQLKEKGQNWLLHVVVLPADTTDPITYASENEAVATVNEEGRVTAVGEGETNIIVTCGDQRLECPVTVKYEEETETTAPQVQETEVEETEPTEAAKPATKDVVLKLKKNDISLGRYGVYVELELDCDLQPEEVEWRSTNMYVAGVDATGRVTALGQGITNVIAKYGDQEVVCIVRCRF